MRKPKVGIYVFTDPIRGRNAGKKDTYFEGASYLGLRFIVSQIPKDKYEITYVSRDTINTVDWVLISITSYYDVLNVIHELHGREISTRISIGGAGYNNVGLLRDIAYVGTVGRGENTISRILDGEEIEGLYYRETNRDLSKPIQIRQLETFIEIEDKFYGGMYTERAIGCPRKCFFCEYSWKHKFRAKSGLSGKYESGIGDRETLFRDLKWESYKAFHHLVSALDGATEKTRFIINKPIKNSEITEKMFEMYDSPQKAFSLKLYCLLGYPFEDRFEPDEAVTAITRARRTSTDHWADVEIVSPHFIPMPFTPMECEPFNWHDFKSDITNYNWGLFGRGNINVKWRGDFAGSNIAAAESTIINRADIADIGKIKGVLCSRKYAELNTRMKRAALEKYFWHLLGRVDTVLPYITRNNDTTLAKEMYRKRTQEYLGFS